MPTATFLPLNPVKINRSVNVSSLNGLIKKNSDYSFVMLDAEFPCREPLVRGCCHSPQGNTHPSDHLHPMVTFRSEHDPTLQDSKIAQKSITNSLIFLIFTSEKCGHI